MNYIENAELQNEVIALRDFHKYPESGWLEYRTSAKIVNLLEEYGYKVYLGKNVCKSKARFDVPNKEILLEGEQRALLEGVDTQTLKLMEGGHTGAVGVFDLIDLVPLSI